MNKNLLIISGVIFLALSVGYITYQKTAPEKPADSLKIKEISSLLSLNIQEPGNKVEIQSLTLELKGFAVVRKEERGNPGKIIGISKIIPTGENKNITIPLSESLRDGQNIFVIAYTDNGDNIFEFPGPDLPTKGSDGLTIMGKVSVAGISISEEERSKYVVRYNEKGFSPDEIEISVGESVVFVNDTDESPLWVASSPHPTHTDLPGFDLGRTILLGETYTYSFTKAGSWEYHNHLNPNKKGLVIVK